MVATDNEASVNGHDVAGLDAYRIATPLFTVALPADNIIGVEPVVAEVVSEGYNFIIAPPPPGEYEVLTSTIYNGQPAPGAFTVIVAAPHVIEPPTS